MTEFDRVVRRLRRSYRRALAECEQAIRDIRYWNGINPDETPIDAGWFLVAAAGARRCLNAIDRNERIEADWFPPPEPEPE